MLGWILGTYCPMVMSALRLILDWRFFLMIKSKIGFCFEFYFSHCTHRNLGWIDRMTALSISLGERRSRRQTQPSRIILVTFSCLFNQEQYVVEIRKKSVFYCLMSYLIGTNCTNMSMIIAVWYMHIIYGTVSYGKYSIGWVQYDGSQCRSSVTKTTPGSVVCLRSPCDESEPTYVVRLLANTGTDDCTRSFRSCCCL